MQIRGKTYFEISVLSSSFNFCLKSHFTPRTYHNGYTYAHRYSAYPALTLPYPYNTGVTSFTRHTFE